MDLPFIEPYHCNGLNQMPGLWHPRLDAAWRGRGLAPKCGVPCAERKAVGQKRTLPVNQIAQKDALSPMTTGDLAIDPNRV